eukprot:1138198-Pelagomonas_calceolata.AAC.6
MQHGCAFCTSASWGNVLQHACIKQPAKMNIASRRCRWLGSYPGSHPALPFAGEGQIVAVLYGALGAQCTWDMHVVLSGIVQQQQQQQQQQPGGQEGSGASVVYALRPVLLPSCQVGRILVCVYACECLCVRVRVRVYERGRERGRGKGLHHVK